MQKLNSEENSIIEFCNKFFQSNHFDTLLINNDVKILFFQLDENFELDKEKFNAEFLNLIFNKLYIDYFDFSILIDEHNLLYLIIDIELF